MKKILAKLMRWGTREDNSKTIHNSAERNEDEVRFSKKKHELIMESRGGRPYVDEGTTIPEGQVRRPDDSAVEKAE